MKLLLLVSLLTDATAQSISPQVVWHWGNVFECNISLSDTVSEGRFYGCFCGLWGPGSSDEDLGRCCQTQDHCYDQVMKLESHLNLILMRNPYTSAYSYLCSGNEITCSGAAGLVTTALLRLIIWTTVHSSYGAAAPTHTHVLGMRSPAVAETTPVRT
ncbi:phospholipase A2-like isoform X2 [Peromyscus maniculatus bairdii]|uniref:phospholipase A2-like isoform X2 n=1 Tax=Peromyscus maniculatus bairdii TaxID=230844 RepID=UPI003FD0C1DB